MFVYVQVCTLILSNNVKQNKTCLSSIVFFETKDSDPG